jgi:phage host-nuclease inhibitor protein Gam
MSALPEDLLPPFLAVDEEPLTDDEVAGFVQADAVDEEDDPHRPRWSIDSDEEAEWAMRKLAYEERALRTINDQAEDWAGRIQQWRDEATKPHKSTAAFFRGALEDYARRQREEGRLSVPLPSGKVSTRNVPASVKVADEATVLDCLPAVERVYVTKESIRLRELQQITAVARTATLHVSCGHSFEVVVLDPSEIGPETVCGICSAATDPDPHEVAITSVELSAPIPVLKTTRKQVPGAIVEPERVSVTVKPS